MITKALTMTDCQECKRLRNKLSPLEDHSFTADLLLVFPVEWVKEHVGRRRTNEEVYVIEPAELYYTAFGERGSPNDLAVLGRSLKALGWEATRRRGYITYLIPKAEFDEQYTK